MTASQWSRALLRGALVGLDPTTVQPFSASSAAR
jgi:hypothetical protein